MNNLSHPYCKYVASIADKNDVDKLYHDNHYGVRIESDDELLCRLVMEINQAGLSWRTILKKEQGLRSAYDNFDIKKVAMYNEKDFARLMNDPGIIRNKLKIHAAIYNAQQIIKLQKEFGSFRKWLDIQSGVILSSIGDSGLDSRAGGNDNAEPREISKSAWLKLFKKHFKFVGGEIVGEFLMSIDILSGSHDARCKVRFMLK